MKSILRNFLINLGAILATSRLLPTFTISGGAKGAIIAALALMAANFVLIPFMKILLLPLNLLTLGFFAWLSNILALYVLVTMVPSISIAQFQFTGANFGGFAIPSLQLSTFHVAIVASFSIAVIMHIANWLVSK